MAGASFAWSLSMEEVSVMASDHTKGVPSRAAIAGHPIHPALIPLPIAFLVGTLAADLGFYITADPFWPRVSLWLVGAGFATGVLAAISGLIDFLTISRAREHTIGWVHALGNGAVLALALISLLLRLSDPVAAVLPWGIALSAIIAVIVAVTGYAGGELVYRHLIGVTGHGGDAGGAGHGHHPADQAQHS